MKVADCNTVCSTAPGLAGDVSTPSSPLPPPLRRSILARAAVIMTRDAVWSLNYYDRPAHCRLRRAEVLWSVREPVGRAGGGAGYMCEQNAGGGGEARQVLIRALQREVRMSCHSTGLISPLSRLSLADLCE